MLEFLVGLLLGVYIGQTYAVPNIESMFESLQKYRKQRDSEEKEEKKISKLESIKRFLIHF